jgi:uncharacterized membrane protein YgcG
MSRCVILTAFFTTLLCLAGLPPVEGQARSVFWKRWDIQIDKLDVTQNRFSVTESYEIDFSGTFYFGLRVIPLTNIENIGGVEVLEGDQPLRASCSEQAGTYCVENTDEGLSITYFFTQSITNGSQTFTIKYVVNGALRVYPDGDQLWWIAIPSDHYGFSIGRSMITVQMPQSLAPREGVDPVETYGTPGTVDVRGTTITATASRQIVGEESFEIRVQYPHTPSARVPAWQTTFDKQRAYEETVGPIVTIGLIAVSLLLLVGGVLGVYGLWYTRGRDPLVGPVPAYLSEPPTNLRPALVGTLLDEKADLRDVISTIVDLAQRGYIVIEETQVEGIFGIGRSSNFIFKRTDKPLADLREFENRVMSALFKGGSLMERSLDSMRYVFYALVPQLQHSLYNTVVEDGFFVSSPQSTRAMWSGLGVALLVIAFIALFVSGSLAEQIGEVLFCVPGSLGIVGFLALIAGQHMPAKTRKGAEDAAKWRAFREYLENLDKYADVEEAAKYFEAYLPYAIAFGLDRAWVRRFSKVFTVPIPGWYYPVYLGGPYQGGYTPGTPLYQRPMSGGIDPGDLAHAGDSGFTLDGVSRRMVGGLENISSGLTNMLDSASRAMTSRPQQSGGSGRWSSGGRSWSGGGFRGGGGSGGGRSGFG